MGKHVFLTFVLIALLFSCHPGKEKSEYPYETKAQKEELEKFFRNLLFWEGGVYTLFGSKPITAFDIFEGDESWKPSLEEISSFPGYKIYLNKDEKESLQFFHSLNDEAKKNAILLSSRDYIFDGIALWDAWERFNTKIKISPKYILFTKEYTPIEKEDLVSSCKAAYHVIFVNVLKTACLLEQYHSFFAKVLGENFDPLEEVLKINDPESSLWGCLNTLSPGDYYQEIGLLLGYGWENTQIFKWKHCLSNQNSYLHQIDGISTNDVEKIFQKPYPFSAKNFPLPTFMTFCPLDPVKRKYEEERKQIMELYKGKDFLETTLDALTIAQ